MLNDGRNPGVEIDFPDDLGPMGGKEQTALRDGFDVDASCLRLLKLAALNPDRAVGAEQLHRLLECGVSRERLIDDIIPQIARHLGEQWKSGGHSFGEVTIATARLQGWLRDIDGASDTSPFDFDSPEVLLVVGKGAQHTLGAMVATSQFRRLGALVRLSLGYDARVVGHTVRMHHVDMVAISAAGSEDLDFLASLIQAVRSGIGPVPRVVLGGEILNQNPDAPALVGADFATSDPREALSLCGLTVSDKMETPPRTVRGEPIWAPASA